VPILQGVAATDEPRDEEPSGCADDGEQAADKKGSPSKILPELRISPKKYKDHCGPKEGPELKGSYDET